MRGRRFSEVLLLEPRIRHYAWGDIDFIPSELGCEPDGRPWAEAWYGAHPAAPSLIQGDRDTRTLDRVIEEERTAMLGPEVAAEYGRLPYLVKLLAAARPLSIQVHPDAQQAEAGFRREEADGVPREAPHRNYRDASHKPELIVALGEFHALCGFRSYPDMRASLSRLPEITTLMPPLEEGAEALEDWLRIWFALPESAWRPALAALLARLASEEDGDEVAQWALRAQRALGVDAPPDRGLLFCFLLELRRLKPGQALFLAAGVPHAYLCGAGIEVMAASDNVLRAGLTPKHVAVQELLDVLRCDLPAPAVIEPDASGRYVTPTKEFDLQRLTIGEGLSEPFVAKGPELVLALGAGEAEIEASGRQLRLRGGAACLIPHGLHYRCRSRGPILWRCRNLG